MSDAMKKSIYKPRPVSGFPEWLPEVRLVEQRWLDHIRRVFESYGFCSIETPSVEELGVLQAKGEVDKEIYVLERLHQDEGDRESRLALHFDQTVPLARYVAQNFNDLVFPFKRYQMQRVWRGERPQAGRFREFTQCDIDVINVDGLPLHLRCGDAGDHLGDFVGAAGHGGRKHPDQDQQSENPDRAGSIARH